MNGSLEDMQYLLGLSDFRMLCLKQDLLFTAQDFVEHSNEELRIILGMRSEAIKILKDRIVSYFTENLHSGCNFLISYRFEGDTITTGISSFDSLFSNHGIFNSDIIEIIGPPAAGKTMLIYTIIINVLLTAGDGFKVILINTKSDFRAMKLINMMEARGIPSKQQRALLEAITIYSCNSPEQLAIDLELIHNRLQSLGDVKMVFIDSITIPFYQYFESFGNSMFSLSLMSRIVKSIKLIADRHIPTIVTNLSLYRRTNPEVSSPTTSKEQEEGYVTSVSSEEGEHENKMPDVYPALGKFWETVAHHKILINFICHPYLLPNDVENTARQISLFYSKTAAATEPVSIKITDQGVI